jgi:hypothetical protein
MHRRMLSVPGDLIVSYHILSCVFTSCIGSRCSASSAGQIAMYCRLLPQVWVVVKDDFSGSQARMSDLLWRLLDGALQQPEWLSPHPASCGARFRLLQLALSWCRANGRRGGANGGSAPAPHVSRLYERVLRAALGWFEAAPAWHAGRREEMEEAAAAARDFRSLVEGVKRWPGGGGLPVWACQPSSAQGNAARHALLKLLLAAGEGYDFFFTVLVVWGGGGRLGEDPVPWNGLSTECRNSLTFYRAILWWDYALIPLHLLQLSPPTHPPTHPPTFLPLPTCRG